MKRRLVSLSALIAAAPIAFAAEPEPVSSLPAVAVSAARPAVRFDVRTACPAIDAALRSALAPAWGRVQAAASMRVRFRLEGQRITQVSAWGTSMGYRPYVRQAVTRLDCSIASSTPQDFAFLLVIHAPDEAPEAGPVALLER